MGIATAQDIKPPPTTKIPIFLPTIYPTEIKAGDKSEPMPKMAPFFAEITFAAAISLDHNPKPD